MKVTKDKKGVIDEKQVLKELAELVKEGKLVTYLRDGERYWLNADKLSKHEQICPKCEERVDIRSGLTCLFHQIGKCIGKEKPLRVIHV